MQRDINVNVSGPHQAASQYKTIVLKGNQSFKSQIENAQSEITKAHQREEDLAFKFVIKFNFDLGGDNVTIPENCVLEFDGGSLNNGTIVGQNTIIASHKKTADIIKTTLFGTFVFDVNMITLAAVATSGSYTDLTDKPSFATVATSGDYNDLTNKPTIPTVPTNVSAFNNDASYTKGSAGNTRPTDVDAGYMFFDTTLGENGGMPIWKTTDGWVDATGTPV